MGQGANVLVLVVTVLSAGIVAALTRALRTARERLASEQSRAAGETRALKDALHAAKHGTHVSMEEKLRESEERFRATFENAAVGMAICAVSGVFVECNRRFSDTLRYSRDEIIGHSFTEFGVPEDKEPDLARVRAFVRGEIVNLARDKRYVRKDGSVLWGHLSLSILRRDEAGNPTHMLAVVQDISVRKSLEQDLERTKNLLELGIRGSQLSIFDLDMPDGVAENGVTTLVNLWERLGYDAADAPRDFAGTIALILTPEDQERVARDVFACLRGEIPRFEMEHQLKSKDGTLQWVLSRASAIRDGSGIPIRFIGSYTDITAVKHVEQRLRESEAELRRAKERLEVAIHSSNLTIWEYQIADGSARDDTGLPAMIAGGIRVRVHPDDRARVTEQIRAYLGGETERFEIEHRALQQDGTYQWSLGRGVVLREPGGNALRFTGTSIDITDMKRIESDLLRAREAAEAANRAKDEFLANVSHEIRTPMNAILGMTELALDSARTDHQRQLLSTVKSAAKNLLGIINDLLDFSKIAAGKLALDEVDFALRAEVFDTLRALAVRAHRKGLELVGHVHPDVPDALFGDAGRVRQVLMNLVGNALKFTAQGEVVVDVATLPASEAAAGPEHVPLVFTIRDTGIGIARDKQSAIFRAFEQEDSSTTRRYGGTGLGLTISAQLAALMSGAITVASEPGHGSTFTFTARLARSTRPEQPGSPSTESLQGRRALIVDDSETNSPPLRVLVAEDNELNVTLLKTLLRKRGHHAEHADNGRLALRQASEAPFDLMLLDLHMPEMDGFEVVSAIRAREADTGKHLPIIALTARSSHRDRDRCLAAGMDDFLPKPIEAEALWAAIDRVIAPFRPPFVSPRRRVPGSGSSIHGSGVEFGEAAAPGPRSSTS